MGSAGIVTDLWALAVELLRSVSVGLSSSLAVCMHVHV